MYVKDFLPDFIINKKGFETKIYLTKKSQEEFDYDFWCFKFKV